MSQDNYHNRPDWSYSQMKVILDSGIDYAVAAKRGMFPGPSGKAIDLGELAHMFVLGGDAEAFVVSPYADFRTKEARNWKAEQIEAGKTIVTSDQYEIISQIVDNIEAHPMSKRLLKGANVRHEIEMFATAEDVKLRGKADAMLIDKDAMIITDIKTTAQFGEWKYKSMRRHYDLQAATYTLIGAASQKISPSLVNFYFCVVETVAPYRVQYHHASLEFLEHGESKLADCLKQIKDFGDKEPCFLIEEVNELGDFSN